MKKLAPLFVGLLFLSGCNAPPPEQVRKTGATLLYDVLIEIDQATAKKDAQFISTAMSTDIIPFVTDSQLPAAQLLPQLRKLLGEKIAGQKYVGAALSIVSMATSFGNVNIKAPKMSDEERAYVLAACNAIQDACDGFLTGKAVRVQLFKPTEGRDNAYLDEKGVHHDGPDWLADYGNREICNGRSCVGRWKRTGGTGSTERENPAFVYPREDVRLQDVPAVSLRDSNRNRERSLAENQTVLGKD